MQFVLNSWHNNQKYQLSIAIVLDKLAMGLSANPGSSKKNTQFVVFGRKGVTTSLLKENTQYG